MKTFKTHERKKKKPGGCGEEGKKILTAKGQRKGIKFNVSTELSKIHCQAYNHTGRLLRVGSNCDQHQPNICVLAYVCWGFHCDVPHCDGSRGIS